MGGSRRKHAAKATGKGKERAARSGQSEEWNTEGAGGGRAANRREAVHTPPRKQRPNEPCRCGSGVKFKSCCGGTERLEGATAQEWYNASAAAYIRGDMEGYRACTRAAAVAGDPTAMWNLAVMAHERGDVAERNEWCRRSAEAGSTEGQYNLATEMEEQGDLSGAAGYYRRAAEAGHVKAQFEFAQCLRDGVGIDQDLERAIYWYKAAAAQGCYHASFNISCSEFHDVLEIDEQIEWREGAIRDAYRAGDRAMGAFFEAQLARGLALPNEADFVATASKALKAAIKENPEETSDLADNLKTLRLGRMCLACGASPRSDPVELKVCSRCRRAWFCSAECLRSAWPDHKAECNRIAAEKEAAKAAKKA